MGGWSGMSCIDHAENRLKRRWPSHVLVVAAILTGVLLADPFQTRANAAVDRAIETIEKSAQTVRPLILPLSGLLTDPRAEVSGMTWKGDTLVIMPQDPQRFGHDNVLGFFVIPKQKILDAISDAGNNPNGLPGDPIEPLQIQCIAPGLARVIRGFDGLEAIGIQGDRCYMTIEAKDDTSMAGFLVCGHYDMAQNLVQMDMTRLTAIPMGLNINNIAEESLVIDGSRVITISEANGRNCNPRPQAKVFDENTSPARGWSPLHWLFRTEGQTDQCSTILNGAIFPILPSRLRKMG